MSSGLLRRLTQPPPRRWTPVAHTDGDPLGEDAQLALTVCYELHYRGFADVDPDWEWDPGLIELRGRLERGFLAELRRRVGVIEAGSGVDDELRRLAIEPIEGDGVSHRLLADGTWSQMREYFAHRSIYHLKEGDPHAWLIPRLPAPAKAPFVAVEYDEFGAGSAARVHQQLWADLMDAAGMDSTYLGYLEQAPAPSLAVVNLMSLFSLHRRWRGAAAGQFAAIEITSPPGSRRMADALARLGAPEACAHFYREHVEADAVHEQVVSHGLIANLVRLEPQLADDIVFGIRAWEFTECQLDEHLRRCWDAGRSSLRGGLRTAIGAG
ncbi:hypothetical protein MBRU_08530 [Mycolicibacterium brumae DSM 44177]|nr:hypothetical protein MBRU_08530 [Mycolicibacterium brumae DSM 44177]